jgi:hypothetical protein
MRTGMRTGMRSGDDSMHGFHDQSGGSRRGTSLTYRFRSATGSLRPDPGHLPIGDRAVLCILNRCRLATAAPLAVLVYRNRHCAQIPLRRPCDLDYLERTQPPPAHDSTRGLYPYQPRAGLYRSPWACSATRSAPSAGCWTGKLAGSEATG